MRIVGVGGFELRTANTPRRSRTGRRQPQAGATQTRALIAIEAAAPSERAPSMTRYPAAPFLAHLIATHMQVPQTRVRRRTEPREAAAAYSATALRPVAPLFVRKSA